MTPHIEAEKNEIAKKVIMPGDPKRAKMIALNYLENPKLVSDVRGICAYTGKYRNKEITVMASGMGNPSMGIYSYELFKYYDVDTIIRVGSCGAYDKSIDLYSLIIPDSSYSISTYNVEQNNSDNRETTPDLDLVNIMKINCKGNSIIGKVHCSDTFYKENNEFRRLYKEGCLAVEMETFALFHNAKVLSKSAACILTVSDNLETKEVTTSLERQEKFTEMVEVALNSI